MSPDGSPTGGALYQLTGPVKLGAVPVFATLKGMNINVGQLLGYNLTAHLQVADGQVVPRVPA
ncbi:hypothetical protein PV729_43035 [Streptomyces europaeiscabiei]|uniref:CHRD domain-containing protein n=1 Tax=Streptomyces europaeiscabiei TaxID=146819 RepID=A0ABU4NUB5_9ACTN|nr:hypothetical protein [Streptomyces europaeiscabiei]MDX2769678.1 hypothetical protein [Streptomyces europaeiscabiei]MDX3558390.1 hypothetical protein [Streptomyces europaeiscabiei]MDX3706531.1 hypothetical protein [Streptomyces europaeiscabiei]